MMLRGNTVLRMKRKKKGQSTMEYLLVVGVVLGVLVVFLGPNGPFQSAYNTTLGQGTSSMDDLANRLACSYP